jgi:hypothetical protein
MICLMGRGPNFKKMNGPSGESNKKPTRLLGFSRIARPPYDDRCLLIFCEKFKSLFPLGRARCRMVWGLSSNPVNSKSKYFFGYPKISLARR